MLLVQKMASPDDLWLLTEEFHLHPPLAQAHWISQPRSYKTDVFQLQRGVEHCTMEKQWIMWNSVKSQKKIPAPMSQCGASTLRMLLLTELCRSLWMARFHFPTRWLSTGKDRLVKIGYFTGMFPSWGIFETFCIQNRRPPFLSWDYQLLKHFVFYRMMFWSFLNKKNAIIATK